MLLPVDRTNRQLMSVFMFCAALLVVIANWSGIGWSWDSTDYISAGRAISHGLGPLDVTAQPMTVRTPGYPALIAIGEWLNLPINCTLVIINAVCASLINGCTYLILYRHTRRTATIFASAFVLLSPTLLWQYTMAWSEPPFIAVLMLIMIVSLYMQHRSKYALLAVLFSALFFLRYVGPVFAVPIAIIGIFVDCKNRGWLKATIGNASALIVSFIPMYWWLMRNHRIDGTYTGARSPGGGTFLQSLLNAFGTIGTFFSGQPFDAVLYDTWTSYPIAARASIVFISIVLIAAFIYLITWINRGGNFKNRSLVAPMSAFVVTTYLIFSAYRFVHMEQGRLDTRMMVPVFIPIVIVATILLDRITTNQRALSIAMFAFMAPFFLVNSGITTRDALRFSTESRHSSTTENKNLPLYQFVRQLPDTKGFFSNAPQQLAPFVNAWPIFNQFQMDTPRPVACTHRFAIWYKGFVLQDNIPDTAPIIYEDSIATVYDLGLCSIDINKIWD